jgi:extradiol dioxygenase family protein
VEQGNIDLDIGIGCDRAVILCLRSEEDIEMPSLEPSATRFHLAFPVDDLDAARRFYGEILGCPEGRSDAAWVDFDLRGHQIVAHLSPEDVGVSATSSVDNEEVPVRHFGLILEWQDWHEMAARLKEKGVRFIIEPQIRFAGRAGEQATMFFLDPAGNALEFKSFRDPGQIFATD